MKCPAVLPRLPLPSAAAGPKSRRAFIHVAVDAAAWNNERGFGRFTRGLVGALAARDSGVRYTLLLDAAPAWPLPAGVEAVVAGSGGGIAAASAGGGSRRTRALWARMRDARRIGGDLFFYPASYSWFPLPSRVPKLVCIHDTIPERFPDLIFPARRNALMWKAKTWMAIRQARRLMTVSEASAEDIARMLKVPRGRIDVITEGAGAAFRPLDPAAFEGARARLAARHGLPGEAPLLVYVGGFNRHKNVARLIEAMPAILARVPDAHLAIVGRITGDRFWDNIEELQAAAAADARAAGRIRFTGELGDDEMIELLNAARALVLPSLWEGFGLPALEAMRCSTPVIASNRGSLPEILGDAGLTFDPASAEELAACAIALLTDPGLRARLAARGLERARGFTWERAADLAEASFRRVLAG